MRGTLSIFPENYAGNFDEGIRIHTAGNGWATITLCGSDNTGNIGSSTNTWSIHNY